jgi:hypothetical protein
MPILLGPRTDGILSNGDFSGHKPQNHHQAQILAHHAWKQFRRGVRWSQAKHAAVMIGIGAVVVLSWCGIFALLGYWGLL